MMVMRTFASLIPKVSPVVAGCPTPTLIQYIRDTAIRVCERTLAWRYQIPLYNLLPGVHEYPYAVPVDTQCHAVFSALLNDTPLEILTLEQAIEKYPKWVDLYSGESLETVWSLTPPTPYNTAQFNASQFNPGEDYVLPESIIADGTQPRSLCQLTPNRYIVLPLPDDATYQMRMFVALKPTRIAEGMDDGLFDELEDAIIHGALQHLLLIPNAAWSDKELASYHARQFLFQLTERRARANIGTARGTVRVKFPSFGV
jgi:hypothetical protein